MIDRRACSEFVVPSVSCDMHGWRAGRERPSLLLLGICYSRFLLEQRWQQGEEASPSLLSGSPPNPQSSRRASRTCRTSERMSGLEAVPRCTTVTNGRPSPTTRPRVACSRVVGQTTTATRSTTTSSCIGTEIGLLCLFLFPLFVPLFVFQY